MSLGLDVGSKNIKVAEVKAEGNRYVLKSAAAISYSGLDLDRLDMDRDFAGLGATIRKLLKGANVSTKDVVMAIPEAQVFSRVIRFPLLTDQEIVSAVKWEAEQYVPIPIAEAIIQHQILERREKAVPPEVLVLLVAAPRKVAEKYAKIAAFAGLNPIAIETELLALTRSVAPPSQTSVVLDFGAKFADLAISKNGNLAFARSIPTAGEAITRAVSQSLGVAQLQAEEYKKAYGLVSSQLEGKVSRAIEPVLRILVEEIKRAVHFYQTEEKGEAPTSLILTGGAAGTPELTGFLANALGMEVVIGNPFAKVVMEPGMYKKLSAWAPLYGIAVGLAMR